MLLALLCGAVLRFYRLGEVPPGLHYDFAANAIIANDIAFHGWRGVFVTAYTGKEVLSSYTAALIFKFVGSSVFALTFTAALYGILGIAACYFAARQLLWEEPDSRWIAALAAAIMAFTFMHVVWSRYGERAVTQPFVQGLAIGFLFRGLRQFGRTPGAQGTGRRLAIGARPALSFALAGLFTGLDAYTYLAARLFPIPVAAALVVFLARPGIGRRARLVPVALYLAAAAVVFAPLGWFFLNHPEAFLIRFGQLTPREGEGGLLYHGVTRALGMIFISGEPYDRFNIPGRPIFGPLLGLFFILGLSLTATRLLRPKSDRDTAVPFIADLFLLVYLPTFLVPTALSVHDVLPSNVRAMGLLPLLAVFPARGLAAVSRWMAGQKGRLPTAVRRLASFPALFLFTTLGGTLTTGYAYFYLWAPAPGLYYANDTDLVRAAEYLNAQDLDGVSVYVSAIHYRHPTVAYLARQYSDIRWLLGGQALAVPEGRALYVFPHAAPPPPEWIAAWTPLAAPLGPDGTPDFRAYRFEAAGAAPLPAFIPASANFGNLVEITGFRVVESGVVDFRLRVLNPPDRGDYRLVADLADSGGHHWAQGFNDAYFSEQWQAGETILMRIRLPVPVGTPPGEYRLLTTIYSPGADTALPALTADGAAAYGATGPVPIARSAAQPPAEPLVVLSGLNLIRLDPPPASARPGDPLPFAFTWQAPAVVPADVRIHVRLNDLPLESDAPVRGTYPTSRWLPGEVVIDRHAPRLPRDLAPGIYQVTANDFLIGTVTVAALDRQFTAPQPSTRFAADFGGLFELVGFDRRPTALTLYWRAQGETDVDYTAFVHLVDAEGRIVAQHDSPPRAGSYPTSLWARGEYVSDTIDIPTEGGTLVIGWYMAETGRRLKVGGETSLRLP